MRFEDIPQNMDPESQNSEAFDGEIQKINDAALGILVFIPDPMRVDVLYSLLMKSSPDLSRENFDQMIQSQVSEGKIIYFEDKDISLSDNEMTQNLQKRNNSGQTIDGNLFVNSLAQELIIGMQKPASKEKLESFIKRIAGEGARLGNVVPSLVRENKISPEFGQTYLDVPETQESTMSDQDYIKNIFKYLTRPVSLKDLTTFITETRPQIAEESIDQTLTEMMDGGWLIMEESNKVMATEKTINEIKSDPIKRKAAAKTANDAIWG